MKNVLLGLTLLISMSFSVFAIDCDCYAEMKVLEGRHNGELQYSKRKTYLGTYDDIYFYEIPLAKVYCSSEVSDWEERSGASDLSSNLDCNTSN